MLPKLLTSIFGSRNERLLKQYQRIVEQINALEGQMELLEDSALKARSDELRAKFKSGTTLDQLLPRGLRHSARSEQTHIEDAAL